MGSGKEALTAQPLHRLGALLLLAVTCAAALLFATRWGIGVGPDATGYLAYKPLDPGHGPFYALLMRIADVLPGEVTTAARIYHAILYAVTPIVAWRLLFAATGSAARAWTAALLIAFGSQAVMLYSQALSEPTFVLLELLTVWLLSSWADAPSPRLLAGAGIAAALAALTRYPGVALAATGALTILIAGRSRPLRRLGAAFGFGVLATLPVLAWMAYIAAVDGTAGGRNAALSGTADAATFYGGVLEAARYLLPNEIPAVVRLAALGSVLAAIVLAAIRRPATQSDTADGARRRHRYLPAILAAFVVPYLALVVLAVLVEPALDVSDRYLYPAYVAMVALGAICIPNLARGTQSRRLVAAAATVLVALGIVRAGKTVAQGFDEGWYFSAPSWRQSPTVAYLNALPGNAAIYSNGYYALVYLLDRHVRPIPDKILRRRGDPNPRYETELAAMRDELRATGGVLAVFDNNRKQFQLPTVAELKAAMPLEEVTRLADGTIYGVAEDSGADGNGGPSHGSHDGSTDID